MQRPDLIVAVDFGMAESGIAFACRNDRASDIEVYQSWPGGDHANACKTPTRLVYNEALGDPPTWGFYCQSEGKSSYGDGGNRQHRERSWFKLLLDQKVLGEKGNDAPGTHEEVKQWITDFLCHIYTEVKNHFKTYTGLVPKEWSSANVEFLFSVPTTWETPEIIEDFRKIIKDAGFGCEGRKKKIHSVTISLTEASAAAVSTFNDCTKPLQKGQSFIVCDAGGGTTDVSALKVVEANQGSGTALEELLPVKGAPIGSSNIDQAFQQLVHERLCPDNWRECVSQCPNKQIAKRMSESSQFQNYKRNFGKPRYTNFIDFTKSNYTFKLEHTDMEYLLKNSINGIIQLIKEQADQLKGRTISYLILSGGFGSNEYLLQQLEAWKKDNSRDNPGICDMSILRSRRPQEAVMRGLLIERIERYERGGQSMILKKCSRASYGVICEREYSKKKHAGQNPIRNIFDNKFYVPDQIDWIIKKGQPISDGVPIVRKFFLYRERDQPISGFSSSETIVRAGTDNSPDSLTDDVQIVRKVPINMTKEEIERFAKFSKKKRWRLGKKHFRIDYEMRVFIGPADISVEWWHNGGKFSEARPIEVEWDINR